MQSDWDNHDDHATYLAERARDYQDLSAARYKRMQRLITVWAIHTPNLPETLALEQIWTAWLALTARRALFDLIGAEKE
jgi:hypothetical protein